MAVRRVYVEKKPGFDIEAQKLFSELKENLNVSSLASVRILQRYDVEDIPTESFEKAKSMVFSEPPVDDVHEESYPELGYETFFAVEFLPGQYDQRADWAAQSIQIITHGERPQLNAARIIGLKGLLSEEEIKRIKSHIINPVEMREAGLSKPKTLQTGYPVPENIKSVDGFAQMDEAALIAFMGKMGFAMSLEDLKFCQEYFGNTEKRDPTHTELRMIDTYWSDHCRHTTFLTEIDSVDFDEDPLSQKIKASWELYLNTRENVYSGRQKDICLMDIATLAMKHLKKTGDLDNLDESDEINACSITVTARINEREEEWLVMFKNETHNHPTEIEPFGGAATCLGGAIRDPLSGRSYVYQAMRVTGSADPTVPMDQTLPGKLPQRVITTKAAHGYSSYGNQIGLATGAVSEIYHPDYVAKRMEIGAVVGAAPKANVVRKQPEAGDIVILLGGRTGRDGCGGATGSSKEHDEASLTACGAEVQKGNAPTERKIQRLFRKPGVTRLIKRCNDFGAGGVSVAIGELADGLDINLDAVPKKYEGLDGTELAISESQERMAVVVAAGDAERFIREAGNENLEATKVAVVTGNNRLRMSWRGKTLVDLSRDFINTNGVKQHVNVKVTGAGEAAWEPIPQALKVLESDIKAAWLANLRRLSVCSQKGLVEQFDSSIGAGTVLMPFGGKHQLTPAEGMAAKLPVEHGDTTTGTVMTYGFIPELSKSSPFTGAVYAIVESLARLVAMGGNHQEARLTLQEYFEKLGKSPEKWGKPFSALLGAFLAQVSLKIPAIGGKDSMSGTFKDINVPPTLVSFALAPVDVRHVISPEFKKAGNKLVLVELPKDALGLPDFESLDKTYSCITDHIKKGIILSASSIKSGGLAEAVSKMAFGNGLGASLQGLAFEELFKQNPGALLLEVSKELEPCFDGIHYKEIGIILDEPVIKLGDRAINLQEMLEAWQETLEKVFPTRTKDMGLPKKAEYGAGPIIKRTAGIARPKVFITVFPGTNCEYDVKRKFEEAGAVCDVFVFRNMTPTEIDESIAEMVKRIQSSQIIMLPGGFSAGDEPEGSAKFIATVFRSPLLSEAVMNHLYKQDGLILGICNGFQALIKLGLLPYGEIRELDAECPTLTFNTIGRHVSSIVSTRVSSNLSPWLSQARVGSVHSIAVSHGEGRFVATEAMLEELMKNGQIATQYVDLSQNPTMDAPFNPNGSMWAIEGITSRDGRIFGKMGHDERCTNHTLVNIPGDKNQKIFEAGVRYFL